VQNLLCIKVWLSPILAALLHGTRALGITQTLRRGTMSPMELRNFSVICAPGSESPLTEFRELQTSLHMKQEGQHPLTGQRAAYFGLLANQ